MEKESESLKGYLNIPSKIPRIKTKTKQKKVQSAIIFCALSKHVIFLVLYSDVINITKERNMKEKKNYQKTKKRMKELIGYTRREPSERK